MAGGSTTRAAAMLREKWQASLQVAPFGTPDTFRAYLLKVRGSQIYLKSWRRFANQILRYAPHLIGEPLQLPAERDT